MVKTRSSQGSASPTTGTKRGPSTASPSPAAKRGKQDSKGADENPEKQQTMEERFYGIEDDEEVEKQLNGGGTGSGEVEDKKDGHGAAGVQSDQHGSLKDGEKHAFDEIRSDEADVKKAAQDEQDTKVASISKNNESIIEGDRDAEIPSSILEKGIIYFFFRGRVGIDDPQGIEDVARSYIILRPIPLGAKLGDGPLEDRGTSRLLALPKKTLPKGGRDRFLVFVEKPKISIRELRDQLQSNDYSTKTAGTRHTPPATPLAEGVYAITKTGRESHLAYEITAPKVGLLQADLGVNEKGSYIMSVKNPLAPAGPANVSITNPAQYPERIQSKFRELRWAPLEPEMLDYEHTQVLIIGEGRGVLGRAMDEVSRDQRDDGKERPEEELEQLEVEDQERVENLKESDPVFADLGLSAKEYSKMKSTW